MKDIKRLLEIREARKRTRFVIKDSHKTARVPAKWRKPRGRHSAVRQRHGGRPRLVSIGYGSPKEIRHLHRSGLQKVLVTNKKELEVTDPKKQGVIISGKIGNKKRIELLRLALQTGRQVFDLPNPQKKLEELELQFKQRKETKKKKLTEKEKKELEKKQKAEEKEKKELEKKKEKEEKPEEETQKEKREEEIKEMEKTLTKKQ